MSEHPQSPDHPPSGSPAQNGSTGRLAWLDLGPVGSSSSEDLAQIAVLLDELESLIHDLVELEIESQGLVETHMPPELSVIGLIMLSSGCISSGTHMMLNLVDGVATEHSAAMTSMLSIDNEPNGLMRWHIVLDGEILAERDFMADDPWVINQDALDAAIERGDLEAHLTRLKLIFETAVQVHDASLDRARKFISARQNKDEQPVIRVTPPEPENVEDLTAHIQAQSLIEQVMRRPSTGQ